MAVVIASSIPQTEISDFAARLIASYGCGAWGRCAKNSRRFLADGDIEGYALWARIQETVEAQLRRASDA